MFTDWLLDLLGQAATWFLGLLGSVVPAPPAWIGQASGFIGTVMGYVGEFDAWVPMSLFGPIAIFVPLALVAGLVIKVARIVASFLTLGGGSAS